MGSAQPDNWALIEQFQHQLERLLKTGSAPIALQGAGSIVHRIRPALHAPPETIVGIIDDDPDKIGRQWAGLPVIDAAVAIGKGVRGVIITAEGPQHDQLWRRRSTLREHGVYILSCPCPHDTMGWDQCLIDQYEYALAASRGIDLLYTRTYPPASPEAWPTLLNPLLERVQPGDTVCEIGSGAGLWTQHLIEKAGTYHAVDYSARLLFEVMEHRFCRHMGKLHLHHDRQAALPGVPDGSIDILFSYDVFVHFKADLVHQFLESARRVLKPGGRILIHFVKWNDRALKNWQQQHTRDQAGKHNIMYYASMDQLHTSARALDLTVNQIGDDFGWAFLAEFTHA